MTTLNSTSWYVPRGDPGTANTSFVLPNGTEPNWFTIYYIGNYLHFDKGYSVALGQPLIREPFSFTLAANETLFASYPIQAARQTAPLSTTSTLIPSQAVATNSLSNYTLQSPPKATGNSTTRPKSDNELAPGPVAGIAIACLVCGAILAGLIIWFCTRRRRVFKKNRGRETNVVAAMHDGEKKRIARMVSMESGSPASPTMETSLPQPLEDKIISGEIAKLDTSIKNHVHSFYHSGRVGANAIDIDHLLGLGNDLPISTGTLSTLLGNSDTREVVLRFCIAWVMISRMKLSSRPDKTFLPPEVAECFQSMRMLPSVQPMVLMKWRATTAQILRSNYGQTWSEPSDLRGPNIEMALKILDPILMPYTDSRIDSKLRRKNLEEIFKRASVFAFTLFSQPSSFDYDWQEQEGVLSGNLCIFPALVQVIDEKGQSLNPPRAFSEAVVRRLDR